MANPDGPHPSAHPPPKDIFGAATLPIDLDNNQRNDGGQLDSDDSEWEYEYSTTETETYYVTLDMSVPDLEIQQPNTFVQGSKMNIKKWRNPLNEPLSHIHDKSLKNLAIDSDDSDEDDDNNFIPPPPESDEMPTFRQPTRRGQNTRTFLSKGKEKEKASRKQDTRMPWKPWGRYGADFPDSQQGDDDLLRRDSATTRTGSGRPQAQKIQVLAFHDANPVFLHNGRTYIGQWGRVVGSDMVFAKNVDGDRYPILRNLKDGVDLVAACSARIMATEVEFTPKAEAVGDEEYPAQFKHEVIRRRGRSATDERGVENEEEEQLEMRRRIDEEHRLNWLMNLQAIKRAKGETDFVPLVLLPPEGDPKAARRRGVAGEGEEESVGGSLHATSSAEPNAARYSGNGEEAGLEAGPSAHHHPYNLPTIQEQDDSGRKNEGEQSRRIRR